MRDAGSIKHAHWCAVLLRDTWRRIHQMDPGRKNPTVLDLLIATM